MPERDTHRPNRDGDQRQERAPRREETLVQAVRGLLDALDRCGVDEPDCPHCGPARAFALTLLGSPKIALAEAKDERLQLRGRAGTEPVFRSTRNGIAIARFPLAVRDGAGETSWHTVVAFGDRAERLRGSLSRGQAVEVIGYLHEREARTRNGGRRRVQELYATVIRAIV